MDLNFSTKITNPEGYLDVKRVDNDPEKTTHTEFFGKGDHHFSWLEQVPIQYIITT